MSEAYAFTADAEGPPLLRFYIYQTKAQADGRRLWMFTVDEYDQQRRSSPLFDTLEPTLGEAMAHISNYTSEPLEWRYMAGGQDADLEAVKAELEG
ncbi:MAG: hypothetical protein JSR45_09615 [Proteobacteria bacterium]|nr:hypothetical protein [Pseudomonadota bacterium]